jgi:hypothetical protein
MTLYRSARLQLPSLALARAKLLEHGTGSVISARLILSPIANNIAHSIPYASGLFYRINALGTLSICWAYSMRHQN